MLCLRGQQRLLTEAPTNKRGLIAGQIVLAQNGHCVIVVIAFVIRRCCTGRALVAVVGNALLQVVGDIIRVAVRAGLVLTPDSVELIGRRRVIELVSGLLQACRHIGCLRNQGVAIEEPANEHGLRVCQGTFILRGHFVIVVIEAVIRRSVACATVSIVGHAVLAIVRLTVRRTVRAGLVDCPYSVERRIACACERSTLLLQVRRFICGLRDYRLLCEAPADKYSLGAYQ